METGSRASQAAARPTAPPARGPWPGKESLFGVDVSLTTYADATAAILSAAEAGSAGLVAALAVHGLVMAAEDPEFRRRINRFDIVVPDGRPVAWAMNRFCDARLPGNVRGPELTLRICSAAARRRVPVYLYGSRPEVSQKLRANLLGRFPDLLVAGAEPAQLRPLSPDEDSALVSRIRRSGARIVFVGLGCPRQENFAFEHRRTIDAVQVCVGAAFDFHAGSRKMAPAWMQRAGLEWLHRLSQEPRRLGRRYLHTNTAFLRMVVRRLREDHRNR